MKKFILFTIFGAILVVGSYYTYLINPFNLGLEIENSRDLSALAPNASDAAASNTAPVASSTNSNAPSTTPRSLNSIFEGEVNSKAEALERLEQVEVMIDRPAPGLDVAQEQFLKHQIIVKYSDQDGITVVPTNGRPVEDVVAEYEDMDNVDFAEPDYVATIHYTPNDPYFPSQWNFKNPSNLKSYLDRLGGVSDSSVNAPAAWDISKALTLWLQWSTVA